LQAWNSIDNSRCPAPHIYRTDERTRHTVNFFLFALSGLFFSLTVLYATGVLHFRGSISGMLWVDLMMGMIVLFLGSGYNKRAILYEDSIEVAGWFYSRKLNFAEIRGRQTIANRGIYSGYAFMLVPSDNGIRKLVLPPYLHTDQFFRDWIKEIPIVPH
jgi:hypothetical protein